MAKLTPDATRSPSSRRAWIEIWTGASDMPRRPVALLAEGVDRNHDFRFCPLQFVVALLAEGVDRNWRARLTRQLLWVALLAEGVDRNKWTISAVKSTARVALLAEGVDRNRSWTEEHRQLLESPSSRRAWIEILKSSSTYRLQLVALLAEGVDRNRSVSNFRETATGRPPRGGRG